MSNWEDFYKKSSELEKPSLILKKYFEMELEIPQSNKKAIDLGCGSGNDTISLLKNGYFVTAVDKEKTAIDIVKKRVSNNSKLDFIIDTFENVKLPKTNLIVANMSLCFCNYNSFENVCQKTIDSILPNGFFVGNFLGEDDEWNKFSTTRSFVSKDKLKNIFQNFKIIYFKEKKYTKQTIKGNMKFWHVYEIIAKKQTL